MKLLQSAPDGGKSSGVTAYFLFESKRFGSIALLRFNKGTREAYHSHAFNALTWWLHGSVTEHHVVSVKDCGAVGDGVADDTAAIQAAVGANKWCKWSPSLWPKLTRRSCFHKIEAHQTTWALTIRGPWVDYWNELRSGKLVRLTHGRKEV